MTKSDTATIDIVRLAEIVDRRPATIRGWERDGVLPEVLRAKRGDRNRRLWTQAQADAIVVWMRDNGRFPGHGLRGYDPTPEQITEQVHKMRTSKRNMAVEA